MRIVTSIIMIVSALRGAVATVRSSVQRTKGLSLGGGSVENMNNAESLTVRLIIGHCGHWDGDGSMLSRHNFERS